MDDFCRGELARISRRVRQIVLNHAIGQGAIVRNVTNDTVASADAEIADALVQWFGETCGNCRGKLPCHCWNDE